MGLGARLGISVLALVAARAAAGGVPLRSHPIRGLEWQRVEISWKLPHEKIGRPGEAARRTCHVFTGYAVLASDEGELGVGDLEFRPRPKGMMADEVCGATFRGRSVRPEGAADANEPLGVFGRLLMSVYPDTFGMLGAFTLFDLETGAKVYEDRYEERRELRFEHGADGPILTYWSGLDGVDCIPRRGEAACWKRIRERHWIPATVPQPDCEKAIAEDPSMVKGVADRRVQIAVRVRVPHLSRREATYLPDRPSCAASP